MTGRAVARRATPGRNFITVHYKAIRPLNDEGRNPSRLLAGWSYQGMDHIHKEILGLMGKADIDCRDEGDVIIIELSGQLDIYNSGDLQKLVEAYMARGFGKFALDLGKVTYLDSSTISIFITCHQRLHKSDGRFMLAGLNGPPLEVFEMAKLHDVLECHPDLDSAVRSAN